MAYPLSSSPSKGEPEITVVKTAQPCLMKDLVVEEQVEYHLKKGSYEEESKD